MDQGPIIIPLDGSKNAENAFPLARLMARVFDSAIRIIRVADPDETARIKDLGNADREFAGYALQRAGDFGLDTSQTSGHLLSGPPAATILKDAEDQKASAIVLASHGRGGFRAAIIGSVADKIVRGSSVPVLVVPGVGGPPSGIGNVLCPLDGSEHSARALPLARKIAAALSARLTLFEAYSVVPSVATGFEYYVPEAAYATREGAEAYLQDTLQPGEHALVAEGDATGAIIQAAASIDADLVVMATSGKGLAGRLVLGSTTDRVLHSLQRPLLIVPPPREG